MAPAEDAPTADAPAPRRRVVFPWAWIGLAAGGYLAIQQTDQTVDIKNLASTAVLLLLLLGLTGWYAVRGKGPLGLRIGLFAAPFLAVYLIGTFYEFRFNGAGQIIGLHRRGASKSDEMLSRVPDNQSAESGIYDWGPGEYDYPRFLGEGPWAEAVGPALARDWQANPPVELWRREIGAGWSSFAVLGYYGVTQEQRGEEELVVCYDLRTGEPVWSHSDPVRFDPEDFKGQMGYQGPRATPTIANDRVYTQGGKGLVNCLDARTGERLWSVDTAEQYGVDVIVWGKSGSPLFAPIENEGEADLVVINVGAPAGATEGSHDASVVAFNAETGEEVWKSGWRQTSYASPQLATLHGERLVLQTCDDHLVARNASDGTIVFEHPWFGQSANMPICSQVITLPENQLLLTKGYGQGASRIQVSKEGDDWSTEPLWSPPIKPVLQTKFSNVVVRDGHAFGLRGELLQCANLETGESVWRKRRRPSFGFGQVLLAGDLLLVSCEESGELVLIEATPDEYNERGVLQALKKDDLCWNNPVIVGDLLVIRSATEAAAYRLPLAGTTEEPSAVDEATAETASL
ncbi:outer membrane biogenesis protein BamB [Planctomycetes bacterium MalM25]|nr:outer membrane biogenesis protein BamB [Planctomycetes bacterium MalM25]